MFTMFAPTFAARGRGLAKLIDGVSNGDPLAIGILVVIVVCVIGWFVYKARSSDS